ncbi:hypothetical protein HaLaN_32822 [Haematococcus lacustris]|uniref:Uncharacterized protein n=1 Tax=Haematococcus lacustris TaxID=44745 RepID=A0A6A0ALG8_HAELA|nr:hypothetical protein HaLaN_32822 [Haematococcus lacustris]
MDWLVSRSHRLGSHPAKLTSTCAKNGRRCVGRKPPHSPHTGRRKPPSSYKEPHPEQNPTTTHRNFMPMM